MMRIMCIIPDSNRKLLQRLIQTTRPSSSVATSSNSSNNSLNTQNPSLIGSIDPPIAKPGSEQPVATKTKPSNAIGAGTMTQMKGFPTPPPPGLCCGSGCPNCVWIQYAEEVMNFVKHIPLHDGVEEQQKKMVRDALEQSIEDENLRVYLLMEIRAKGF